MHCHRLDMMWVWGMIIVLGVTPCAAEQTSGPRQDAERIVSRYPLPASVLDKPFSFAGERIPMERPDVQARILHQVNSLLLDARSKLIEWLTDRRRYAWICREGFEKEGIPQEFLYFSPVISALAASGARPAGAGIWMLDKPCDASTGVRMETDQWHDDRLDYELATQCFATRIKGMRKELSDRGWLMTAAAYVTSTKTIQDYKQRWGTESFWDLPLPDDAEKLVARWIALAIISGHRKLYGLNLQEPPPIIFDQVTGLVLAKDLPVSEFARMMDVPARRIMDLNPRLKPGNPVFPARADGKELTHTIAAPKGKGNLLVEKLKTGGYLAPSSRQ